MKLHENGRIWTESVPGAAFDSPMHGVLVLFLRRGLKFQETRRKTPSAGYFFSLLVSPYFSSSSLISKHDGIFVPQSASVLS